MHQLRARAHLEPLLIALVLVNPLLAEEIDAARLSPAAAGLLAFASEDNTYARAHLVAGAVDDFGERLAQRVGRLTMDDLLFYPAHTVVGLVNALPRLGAVSTLRRVA